MKNNALKSTFLLLFLGAIILNFSNCNKILDAFDIDASFSKTLTIDVGPDDELIFEDEEEIDLSNNEDFNNNKDQIDKFTLKELNYMVEYYEGDPGIYGSGTVVFLSNGNQVGDAIAQSDVDFHALSLTAETVVLPVTENTKDAVAEVLKNNMKITVAMMGTVTNKPVYVDLKVTAVIKAKVQP